MLTNPQRILRAYDRLQNISTRAPVVLGDGWLVTYELDPRGILLRATHKESKEHRLSILTWEAIELSVDDPFPEALEELKGFIGDDNQDLDDDEEEPRTFPKILVMGYGRHGKDTVSAMLAEVCNLNFVSSSEFCAEKVILQAIYRGHTPELEALQGKYHSASECFNDRHIHRSLWYDTIRAYNRQDATALGRAIFKEHDIYCGLRSKTEFHALKNSGLVDIVIWVDASDRLPPEEEDSCTVKPWMADFTIDNNGTQGDLVNNVRQLMGRLK